MSVVRQFALAGVSRATFYAQQKPKLTDENNLLLSKLIDEEYTRYPFYASGHSVNRKRVQGLMRNMGLAGMAPPGPNTSRPTLSKRYILTCYAVSLSPELIRSGVRISPISG